jgi:hypothetical protein
VTFGAERFSSPLAAAKVSRLCDGFEVCWVYTPSISAQVVNLKTFRDLAEKVFVRDPVDIMSI